MARAMGNEYFAQQAPSGAKEKFQRSVEARFLSPLQGWLCFRSRFPGLTPWATICRPCGALSDALHQEEKCSNLFFCRQSRPPEFSRRRNQANAWSSFALFCGHQDDIGGAVIQEGFIYGGEGGIRTHGRVSPTHAFQACSLSHSDTSPLAASHPCGLAAGHGNDHEDEY